MNTRGIAIVTGATSGIGAAFARRLAAEGCELIITGRRAEQLEAVAAQIRSAYGVQVETVIAELTREENIGRVEELCRTRTPVRVLVNNAGFGDDGEFEEQNVSVSVDMIRVHCEVPVRLCRAVLPQMIGRGEGTIINVSSVAAFGPTPSMPAYGSTKAMLNSFTEALSERVAARGLRVQALCPGFTRTDFHARIGWESAQTRDTFLRRWMTPEAVVDESLRALPRGRVIVIPGAWNRLLVRAQSSLPLWIIRALRGFFMPRKAAQGQ